MTDLPESRLVDSQDSQSPPALVTPAPREPRTPGFWWTSLWGIVIFIALVSFVGGLAAHATNHHSTGLALGSVAAALLAVGLLWLWVEHRRVRGIEERWYAEHPEAYRQRPSS